MAATNSKALTVNPGILEVAVWTSTLPVLNSTLSNAATVRSAMDALSFTRLASITDLKVSENWGDKIVEVITDDNGTIYKSAVPSISIKGNWYEVGEYAAVNKITGKDTLSIAASPVTVTAEAHGTGWTVGTPIKANYKNGANTIVSSIVVKQGVTTLALTTDYTTYVGDGVNGLLGYTYIVPVSAQTNAITFGYSYTPSASQYMGGTIQNTVIPQLVIRVTSTDPETSKVKIVYLINSGFDGELVNEFSDIARAGTIGASPFTFTGNRLGQILAFTDDL